MATEIPQLFETRCLSSLSKVFADSELMDCPVEAGTALCGEVFSYQAAYRSHVSIQSLRARVESRLQPYISVRIVGLTPSELAAYADPDNGYLRVTPGLYPDPLYPLSESLRAVAGQWRSVWITVRLPSRAVFMAKFPEEERVFPIELSFFDDSNHWLGAERFSLEVILADLPRQRLLHTEWFHCDCLATQYEVEVFSEPHWRLMERYIRNAADHGVNMAFTPLFTPPLDTAVGGERPTVQLVGVEQVADREYRFDFVKLDRWVKMCREAGIPYFELAHLFTQWGAKHAPKIMAGVAGEERRIFGWDTDAVGESYRCFLDQFLPALARYIRERGLESNVYFHVSDEPKLADLGYYRAAYEMLGRHLDGFAFIEALSDYEFYEQGLISIPVVKTDHMDTFLAHGAGPLWAYYCSGQHREVSNRFFSMPSSRNRILGWQLYKFNIHGFLHWGYNFWYSEMSLRRIDPYRVTDGDCAFPSGDAFAVYPGADGPVDSIRWEVFRETLQDLRALQLLESLIGKQETMLLAEEELDRALTFKDYPVDIGWLLGARERINRAIGQVQFGKRWKS